MEMLCVGVFGATSGCSEGCVLDGLKFVYVRIGGDGRPYGAGVFKDGVGDDFV